MKLNSLLLLSAIPAISAFTTPTTRQQQHVVSSTTTQQFMTKETSRNQFVKQALSTAFLLTSSPVLTRAAEEDDASSSSAEVVAPKSIEACAKVPSGKPNNCVSTFNIKNLDTYSPPWTYETTPQEAYARLKGLFLTSDMNDATILTSDETSLYLKVQVQRNAFSNDVLEFQIKPADSVILFKSAENGSGGGNMSDFGANRKRMEDLRVKSGVFGTMGGSAGTFDYGGGRGAGGVFGGSGGGGNGFVGQLKAFYGLQSGEGFQDVFEE
uniref:Plastid lipid-associated protein/fibrillin conserved domain-containing protein n=1 Tax=Ditylum brightwellii TaxID=49249 RepID=A0A7S2EAZ1_9STRA|mmetsp:Transcript_22436/g.33397  ORF Transcript_22436/g.33397 Transcript_22436/m.33397 type:complete len:268 (+) Transcript_22436:164-967(+)